MGRASMRSLPFRTAEIHQVMPHLQLRTGAVLDSSRNRSNLRIVGALERENAIPAEDSVQRRAHSCENTERNWSLPRFAACASSADDARSPGQVTLGRLAAAAFFSALTFARSQDQVRLLWPSLVVRP